METEFAKSALFCKVESQKKSNSSVVFYQLNFAISYL